MEMDRETTTSNNTSTNGSNSASVSSGQTKYYTDKYIILKAIYLYAFQLGLNDVQKHTFAELAIKFLEQSASFDPLFLNYEIKDQLSVLEHINMFLMSGHILEIAQLFKFAVGSAYITMASNSLL